MQKILRIIRLVYKINWLKTLYINFKTQPINIAVKLPIIVYGKLKIYSLKGNIKIAPPISMGMIHIGKDLDHNPVSLNPIKFTINGTLKFNGHALISGGSTITVWRGEIEIGKNVALGSGVQLKCIKNITIGDCSRIIALCSVMDTNVHYIKNILTGKIKKSFSPIKIGKNCWINSNSIISKGTIIPDYCIAAQNTFLNKDYSKFCNSHTFFAGSPAKPISTNVQRIFDYTEETRLNAFFNDNPGVNECLGDGEIYKEPTKTPKLFKLY